MLTRACFRTTLCPATKSHDIGSHHITNYRNTSTSKHLKMITISPNTLAFDHQLATLSNTEGRPAVVSPMCEFNEDDLRANDVLWGRSSNARCHSGNIAFRRLVRQYRPEYQCTRVRDQKSHVVRTVIDCISRSGGRFLKSTDDKGTRWFEVSYNQAYEKVSHALRSAKSARTPRTCKKKPSTSSLSLPSPGILSIEEATYENLLARQKTLLESFKRATQSKLNAVALPRSCSTNVSSSDKLTLSDLDGFLTGIF